MSNPQPFQHPQRASLRRGFGFCTSLGVLLLSASACTAYLGGPGPEGGTSAGGAANVPGPPVGGSASGGTSAGAVGGGVSSETGGCTGADAVSSKRIVRLSFNQIANSLASLLNQAFGAQVVEEFELVDAEHRAFPPLQSPREGNSFTDQSWGAADRIAQAAGQYVYDNLAAITNCTAEPNDACALEYLTTLAKKAYRRELKTEELARITALYNNDFKGAGASVNEAVQYGVYAIFQSPHFLYRTEFGMDAQSSGPLTELELASMLAYFLTDDAPDPILFEAAEAGMLQTEEQIRAHVDRILATDKARENLVGAMMSYFAYPNLETQIIQDDAFTGDMRRSMYTEAKTFLERTLWDEPLNALLLSRKGYADANLAPIYGLSGALPGNTDLMEFELPATRTGILTQAGFLANRSRPDHTSVVGRGLLIKNAFLCTETEAPSDSILAIINNLTMTMPDASEREMADLRAESAACAECHSSFDAYGLALDTFDVLGRYRTVDELGRTIDSSVTLPEVVGGGEAQNVVEVAHRVAESGAFAKCMGQNLLNYALADVSAGAANISSCAVAQVAERFSTSEDQSFDALVSAVVTSQAFSQRIEGAAQ